MSQHQSRINDVLYYIHKDISQPLTAAALAEVAAYSEQHFHRVFKQVVGESVHQYIRRLRMEFAANQLMFDANSPVLEIAERAGFSSLSSFSRVFKQTFAVSPGQWRSQDVRVRNPPYLSDQAIADAYQRLQHKALPQAEIIELPPRPVAYIRHQGYGRTIRQSWQILQAWANSEGREFQPQFGLHHSNPAWVELEKCRYVACVAIDKPLTRRGVVNSLTIPGGLHAVFEFSGKYGELLPQISKVLEDWLPDSGLKMSSTPAYVEYKKNQFLDKQAHFELKFCLPVSLY